MPIPTVTFKLGRMRKADRWVIYPRKTGERMVAQADAYIAAFDPETGEGVLSARRSGGAYFLHLSPALGAKAITVPREVIDACLAAEPGPGPVRIVG